MPVEGATLRYVIEGSGTDVLVLGSSVYYPRTFSAALRGEVRLVFMDLRHFSQGSEVDDHSRVTLDTYVDDIDRVRAALGIRRCVLVGHSHHGNVALEYSARCPDRVTGLVLLGTPPCNVQRTVEAGRAYWDAHATQTRKAILERNLEALAEHGLGADSAGHPFVARYVAEAPRYWADPGYDGSWLWRGVPVNAGALDAFRGFFVDYDFVGRWPGNGMPVMVVMGRHDYVVPPVLWDSPVSRLPGLTLHLFEHSGHTPQLEEPEHFDDVFRAWIDTVPSGVRG
ncbi:alpha/beta fold hydrolase [Thioalkalivibrio denitrificans]|uniref:alpha/beta fold hydrolase n=1 Tax=Thioalkalivibrio denitrificans TaxID=108003 RepID=UPI001FEC249F|nr:alpha/beta hydrolase [Thioalkalivibrio denitrificans]